LEEAKSTKNIRKTLLNTTLP